MQKKDSTLSSKFKNQFEYDQKMEQSFDSWN